MDFLNTLLNGSLGSPDRIQKQKDMAMFMDMPPSSGLADMYDYGQNAFAGNIDNQINDRLMERIMGRRPNTFAENITAIPMAGGLAAGGMLDKAVGFGKEHPVITTLLALLAGYTGAKTLGIAPDLSLTGESRNTSMDNLGFTIKK